MRKLSVVLVALLIAGCGPVPDFLTVGVDNPITLHDLELIEQNYKVALGPTVYYLERRTCKKGEDELKSWITLTPFNPCHQYARAVIVRGALETASKYRKQVSAFVKQNRTVDAKLAYSELLKAVAVMRDVPQAPGAR